MHTYRQDVLRAQCMTCRTTAEERRIDVFWTLCQNCTVWCWIMYTFATRSSKILSIKSVPPSDTHSHQQPAVLYHKLNLFPAHIQAIQDLLRFNTLTRISENTQWYMIRHFHPCAVHAHLQFILFSFRIRHWGTGFHR